MPLPSERLITWTASAKDFRSLVYMMREIIILTTLIAGSFLSDVGAELKVTQVQVLFRHGDRTPDSGELQHDIGNINASEHERWGLGQLTNKGKMRAYRIGQVLRTRHHELLGSLYTPSAVYAISTDCDRTKMSLQLVLAALFPPSKAQTWNSELPWQPIPIHYTPNMLDVVLNSASCPQFQDAYGDVMELPEVQEKIAGYNDFFKFLEDHGVKFGRNSNREFQVYGIYNRLVSERSMNLRLPKWCTEEVFRRMSELISLQYDIWSYTMTIKRIYGGPMVRRFIENMHLNRTQENPRKIYLYSAHDGNIMAFLRAQGIREPRIPHYGTAVMIEKVVDDDGRLYVRLLLWTGVTEKLITLRLSGCEYICPIEEYLQLTREVIPSDEGLDCHWKRLSTFKLRNAVLEYH